MALPVAGLNASGSGESSQPLAGSYPIVLSHGILGFDDTAGLAGGFVKYWGGMDDYLRAQGVPVLTPGKTAMQSLDVRAGEQRDSLQSSRHSRPRSISCGDHGHHRSDVLNSAVDSRGCWRPLRV